MARKGYDMIYEILARFNFEKVHKTMTALNWKWAGKGVPNIEELKQTAEDLLDGAAIGVISDSNDAHHDATYSHSTGGFKASAWRNEENELVGLQLEFIVTEWDAYDDETED